MGIEDAKSIKIADYLHSIGYGPIRHSGGRELFYLSPLRNEFKRQIPLIPSKVALRPHGRAIVFPDGNFQEAGFI